MDTQQWKVHFSSVFNGAKKLVSCTIAVKNVEKTYLGTGLDKQSALMDATKFLVATG